MDLPIQVVIAAHADLEDVRSYRNYTKSRCTMSTNTESFPRVVVDFQLGPDDSTLPVMLEPADWQLLTPAQEIR